MYHRGTLQLFNNLYMFKFRNMILNIYTQVLAEFRAFRQTASTVGSSFRHSAGQFWEHVLDERQAGFDDAASAPRKYENMFRLYLLTALIPTSSTDVERAFSAHKQILGVHRTNTKVQNVDTRLRGMIQIRPLIQKKGVRWAGARVNMDPDFVHPFQFYSKLLKGEKLSEFLSITMHTDLSLEKNSDWLELYEKEFENVVEEVGASEHEFLPESMGALDAREKVETMCRLLARGLPSL